jgi:F0F1-type ATP synthase alpha subunit
VSDSTDVSRHACDDQPVHLSELISTAIRARLGSDEAVGDLAEIGRVMAIGDQIARVSGVESSMLGQMLEFPGGLFRIAAPCAQLHRQTSVFGHYCTGILSRTL